MTRLLLRHPRKLAASLVLLGLVGCYLVLIPPNRHFITSTSPDGQYLCVVTYKAPCCLQDSPHVYTLTIRDAKTGRDLPGEPYVFYYDSLTLDKTNLEFEWKSDSLIVKNGPHISFTGSFSASRQRWSYGSPATRPEQNIR